MGGAVGDTAEAVRDGAVGAYNKAGEWAEAGAQTAGADYSNLKEYFPSKLSVNHTLNLGHAAGAVKDGAVAAGQTVVDGAKSVGGAVKDGVVAAGETIGKTIFKFACTAC